MPTGQRMAKRVLDKAAADCRGRTLPSQEDAMGLDTLVNMIAAAGLHIEMRIAEAVTALIGGDHEPTDTGHSSRDRHC